MHDIPKEKKPDTHTQNLSEEKIVSEGKKIRESAAHQVPRSSSASTDSAYKCALEVCLNRKVHNMKSPANYLSNKTNIIHQFNCTCQNQMFRK